MLNADIRLGSEWPVKMIKAVLAGKDACSVLRWEFRLDMTGSRTEGVGSRRGSCVVVAEDDCVCTRRLSGVTLGVTPTNKNKKYIHQQGCKGDKVSSDRIESRKRVSTFKINLQPNIVAKAMNLPNVN